jgi:tetratricopeptide (TPR) repeat protein
LRYLPRVYSAASFGQYTGNVAAAIEYAKAAVALESDEHYIPFEDGWASLWLANAYRFAGRVDRFLEISSGVGEHAGGTHVAAQAWLLYVLPVSGPTGAAQARAIAPEAVQLARGHGNPFYVAMAVMGYARAFAATDPERALAVLRDALVFTKEHRVSYVEALVAREAAGLAASHGLTDDALVWFDMAIDSFHRAGNLASLGPALAYLSSFLGRLGRFEDAATIYGSVTDPNRGSMAVDLNATIAALQQAITNDRFKALVAEGAAMPTAAAVHFARSAIERAQGERRQR